MSYVTCSCWTRDLIENREKKGYFRDFRNSVPANNVYHKISDTEFNTLMGNLLTGNLNVRFRQIPTPPPLPPPVQNNRISQGFRPEDQIFE